MEDAAMRKISPNILSVMIISKRNNHLNMNTTTSQVLSEGISSLPRARLSCSFDSASSAVSASTSL